MLDMIVVAVVVGGAVAYLAWSFIPHRRQPTPPCAACTHSSPKKAADAVRTPGAG
jgi:hypothetical protein